MNDRLRDIQSLAAAIGRPVRIMEVCGTHTMSAFRSGLRSMLPASVRLISGPGCPVCVTTSSYIDRAIAMASQPDTIVTSFGDMLRVPGARGSLEQARARGARVAVVYSPEDALEMAVDNPGQTVIFLAVGFETTAPTVAWTLRRAATEGVLNFLAFSAHKTMPFAMKALLDGGENRIDGFLCPGHVSVVIGARAYEFICRDYSVPCVVAGFEPADILAAIEMLLRQVADGCASVQIQYSRSVGPDGNRCALELMNEVFEPCDADWRGLGLVPASGLRIRSDFSEYDALIRFGKLPEPEPEPDRGCKCGQVLRGEIEPGDCPLMGIACTPATPVGPCMVSSEGACAAWFKYTRRLHLTCEPTSKEMPCPKRN